MPFNKNIPQLQPYPRTMDTPAIFRTLLLFIIIVIGVGGVSFFMILADYHDAPLNANATQVTWEIAGPFFIAFTMFSLIATLISIKKRVDQGKWLAPPEAFHDTSPQFILSKVEGGFRKEKIAALMIFGIIFMLFTVSADAIRFLMVGLITGSSLAMIIRSSIDIYLDVMPYKNRNGKVTQHSLQKYLKEEYGSIVMLYLFDEAKEELKQWRMQIYTQAGLEAWAEETYRKLGSPPR